jgi:hypothetical protein
VFKKTITYEDYNGQKVTEDFYFHLSKAELMELELSKTNGLSDFMQRLIQTKDGKEIVDTFKTIILSAYGQKSEDGRRFIKTPELREEFTQTPAYSELFMEFAMNAEAGSEFIRNLVPDDIAKDLPSMEQVQAELGGEAVPPANEEPAAEKALREMSREELMEAYKQRMQEGGQA